MEINHVKIGPFGDADHTFVLRLVGQCRRSINFNPSRFRFDSGGMEPTEDPLHRLRIPCTGGDLPVIEIWVNDLNVCAFDAKKTMHPQFDAERAKAVVTTKGSIGLQIHGGKRWKAGQRVYWRGIRIRDLSGR